MTEEERKARRYSIDLALAMVHGTDAVNDPVETKINTILACVGTLLMIERDRVAMEDKTHEDVSN